MYTILIGNPADGFTLNGIFETREDAIQYINTLNLWGDWWIVKIENI